ncbi:LysR family transcriptional regulator [Actinocorallia herbida]|uniref:LysR family transcriptional regulator n=1 Tax=Actinocorallia herbida TaxID=58109 RepID=A0A3N1CTW2_9ACTN|nr:LysR substrate-binding domain-containing protein [Actinocorallia herbida]ROO84757.1 LysR family transcriptional regulator [Actinocorallia herbida]
MDRGPGIELRDIEIFLVLAEELHFGRTAERLRLSQARVSQSIGKQERRVGAPLFERTSRSVRLTVIGARLRDDLRQGHDLIRAALARAESTARGVLGTLRLGVMGALGHELAPVVAAFRDKHPDADVRFVEFHFSDPFAPLRAGDTDVQLLWLPVREPDLAVGPPLFTEGRVLAVAEDSPLALHPSASLEDLADRSALDPGPDVPAYWFESMLPAATPRGRPIPRGPRATTFHAVLAQVAAGRIVCPLNAHVVRYYSHPGIAFVPIHDAPATEWSLVWPAARATPLVEAFTDAARTLFPQPVPLR